MGCFLKLLKLNGELLEKQTHLKRIKIKQNNQYLKLKVSRNNQRTFFLLKKTVLKNISLQEKGILTT